MLEAFKTELINEKGDIEEIHIKSELDRQNFITANNYLQVNNIEDFKNESKYVRNQERLNLDRSLSEDLHKIFKNFRYGHLFKEKQWKKERFKIERFKRINNNLTRY